MPISSRLLKTYAAGASGASFTIGGGQNAAAGEFLLALVSWSYDGEDWSQLTMPGWAVLGDNQGVRNTYSPYLKLFSKTAGSGEGNYTVNRGAGSAEFACAVVASTGVDLADPIAGESAEFSSGGRGSGSCPSYSPTGAPARAFWFLAHQNPSSATTITWGGNCTEIAEATAQFDHAGIAYQDRAATGATGTRSWSLNSYGGNTDASTASVALREAPTADNYVTTPGRVTVSGPPPVVTLPIPAVRAYPDPGLVTVTGPSAAVTNIARPGPGAVTVTGPPPRVAHVYHTAPGAAAVSGPPAFSGALAPDAGRISVYGPPPYVGFRQDGAFRGLPPVVFPPTPRLIAQRILTGEWLSWELPVTEPEVTWTLSGPTLISGKFEPEIGSLAELGLDAWGTWIHLEDSGLIRASGILQPATIDGDTLSFDAVGPSGYAARVPYRGTYSQIGVDPADVVRELWSHIQSYPRGDLGVVIIGSTPVRLGTEPAEDVDFETGAGEGVSFQTGGPYRLDWFENTLCGKEIDDLAKETPFDYLERCAWNPQRTAVEHWIEIGYPTIGRRLFDARFAQGENILEHASIEEPESTYADQVFVQGKGEGSSTVVGYAGTSVGDRLRLPVVVEDKTVESDARARALASEELAARLAALVEVPEVVVDVRDDNALLGTFGPGDEGLIELFDLPYVGTYREWSRLTSVRYLLDREVAVLSLSRRGEFSDR